jgi:hypothetical protein
MQLNYSFREVFLLENDCMETAWTSLLIYKKTDNAIVPFSGRCQSSNTA